MYPARRHRRLSARGLHRGPGRRGGLRDPRLPRPWRDRPDRLHRGAPVAQARSVGRAAERLRRPEQPGPRRSSATRSGRASASTPARAATRTRPTAPTSTTRSCCRALFRLNVGHVLRPARRASRTPSACSSILGGHATGSRRIFVGVIDPIDPRVETAEEVRDRVLEAARYIDPATSARPTTAASRRSATTRRRRATRRSRRSRRGSRGRRWRRARSGSEGRVARRGRARYAQLPAGGSSADVQPAIAGRPADDERLVERRRRRSRASPLAS